MISHQTDTAPDRRKRNCRTTSQYRLESTSGVSNGVIAGEIAGSVIAKLSMVLTEVTQISTMAGPGPSGPHKGGHPLHVHLVTLHLSYFEEPGID